MELRYVENRIIMIRQWIMEPASGTLLFVHGLGESGLCFESFINLLRTQSCTQNYNCIVPDLPGYGRSPAQTEPMSIYQQAEFIIQLRQEIAGPCVLIGHSMGGVIGQIASLQYPDTFQGFINIEGNLSPGDCVFSGQAADYSLEEFKTSGFNKLKNTVFHNGIEFPAQKGYFASMSFADAAQFHLNSIDLVEFSKSQDTTRDFTSIVIPHHYIAGQPRGICSESMKRLRNLNASISVIEQSGHWPFIDQPEMCLGAVTGFLEEIA